MQRHLLPVRCGSGGGGEVAIRLELLAIYALNTFLCENVAGACGASFSFGVVRSIPRSVSHTAPLYVKESHIFFDKPNN